MKKIFFSKIFSLKWWKYFKNVQKRDYFLLIFFSKFWELGCPLLSAVVTTSLMQFNRPLIDINNNFHPLLPSAMNYHHLKIAGFMIFNHFWGNPLLYIFNVEGVICLSFLKIINSMIDQSRGFRGQGIQILSQIYATRALYTAITRARVFCDLSSSLLKALTDKYKKWHT